MAFQACLETHCIGELGDADDDNGDNKFLIYGSALGLAGKFGDQNVSVVSTFDAPVPQTSKRLYVT